MWVNGVMNEKASLVIEKSQQGILYKTKVIGSELSKIGVKWFKNGNETKDMKYVGEIRDDMPNGQGKLTHKKMDKSFGKDLRQFRCSQGYTQKDLAHKLNIPVKDINEIESGKMKHNSQLMGKIKRLIN